jgi:glycosyltransferase involved in cell wall biosynthesis
MSADRLGATTARRELISIVVPVYNEAATVARVLARLERLPFERQIVVVDDGSTDATAAIVAGWAQGRADVEFLHVPHRGKGAAIRAALARVRGTIVVFHDADEEYDPAEIPALIAPLLKGEADVVFGSRLAAGSERNRFLPLHRLGNRVLSVLTSTLFDVRITDMETGHKAFRRAALVGLELHEDGFAIEPELAARVARAGLRLAEVPVSYRARTAAEGKKIRWRDGLDALRVLVTIRFPATATRVARASAALPLGAASALGGAAGALTFAAYLVGSDRSYDYDSSETVGSFIATRSLLDPFRRQLVYNNHPLFSFLDHLVYSAGARTALELRILPVLFGAIVVAVVVGWCARRWGLPAAATAGLVLAANPSFAELSRSVRGYSLLCLCAALSTLLVERLLVAPRRLLGAAYVMLVAAGIATHVYMLLVLFPQAVLVVLRGGALRSWLRRWAIALLLGALAYADIGAAMIRSASRAQPLFRPRFPLLLLTTLLGGTRATLVILGALALLGAALAFDRALALAVATLAVALLSIWLWLAPRDLYPRFLIWLAPLLAVAVAASIRRIPVALPLVAVAAVVMIHIDVRHWTQNPLPNREAAQLVRATRRDGGKPCVLPLIRGSLLAYTKIPHEVTKASQLRECQLVLGLPVDPASLRNAARRRFQHRWRLDAWMPMIVYSQLPQRRLLSPAQHRS